MKNNGIFLETTKSNITFGGLRIDTCKNRTSAVGNAQYHAYPKAFNFPYLSISGNKRKKKETGGTNKSAVLMVIQRPFKELDVVIDVTFLMIERNVSTLFPRKDMLENGLNISIQWWYVWSGPRRYRLEMENYFLIHKCTPEDAPYVFHTKWKLRKFHRTLSHPLVNALNPLVRRANNMNLNAKVRRELEKTGENWKTCKEIAPAPDG